MHDASNRAGLVGLVGLTLASSMDSPWALMLVYLLDSLAAAKAVEAVVAVFLRVLADRGAGSDVVGIFVTKKLLIGWHFLAAKANWDLADLPIGGSFVGWFVRCWFVRWFVRWFIHWFVRWFVRLFVRLLVRSTAGAAALRDTAWL